MRARIHSPPVEAEADYYAHHQIGQPTVTRNEVCMKPSDASPLTRRQPPRATKTCPAQRKGAHENTRSIKRCKHASAPHARAIFKSLHCDDNQPRLSVSDSALRRWSRVTYAWMGLPLIFRKVDSMPKDNATIATKTLTDSRLLLAMSAANAATHATAAAPEIHGVDPRLRAV